VSYFVLYMSSPCLVGLAAEVNKTVKLSNCLTPNKRLGQWRSGDYCRAKEKVGGPKLRCNQLFIMGGNFHELSLTTSSCLFNCGTNFSQTVTDEVLFAIFPKMRTYHY